MLAVCPKRSPSGSGAAFAVGGTSVDVKHVPGPALEALKKAIVGLAKAESRVGWFPSAKYQDGTPVAGIMMVQEFGSAKRSIPPRPTMRPTAATKADDWARMAEGASRAVLSGKLPPTGAVSVLALAAEADVRRAIIRLVSPPLSPLTILARKHRRDTGRKVAGAKELGRISREGQGADVSGISTKPLNDTGLALATLTHEVLG